MVPNKILAFAASNSRESINKMLVTHAASVLKAEMAPEAEVVLLDLNDFEMPIYSIDRENEAGIPQLAHDFSQALGDTDVILISYAEHNGTYSAAFKNIFDWCSRIDRKVFHDKPMMIMSTSPGGRGGAGVLNVAKEAAGHFAADLRGSLAVGSFYKKFDVEAGELIDPELAAVLREQLALLA